MFDKDSSFKAKWATLVRIDNKKIEIRKITRVVF